MSSNQPYRPAPAFQQVLDNLERLANPLDQMTRENIASLWLLRKVLPGQILHLIPLAGFRDVGVPVRNR